MQKNRTLGLIVTGHGVAHWYNGIMGVLYPILTVSLGLTYSQVGLFDSGRGAVAVIVSLAGGYLADRFGQQRLFLAFCLISLGIFTSLLGFATMFTFALLLLMGGGIGTASGILMLCLYYTLSSLIGSPWRWLYMMLVQIPFMGWLPLWWVHCLLCSVGNMLPKCTCGQVC